jgi:histidine triad (HIT) family protein
VSRPGVKQQSLAAPSPFEAMPPSTWLAESEDAYAIKEQYAPTAPVHLLVVPKQRYASILEPPPEVLGQMLDLARHAAHQQGIAESGFRVTINTNPHGPQTVYHLHVHVQGGRQLREPLWPYLWARLRHL